MTARPASHSAGLTDVLVPACGGTDASRAIAAAVALGRRLDLPVRSFEYKRDRSVIASDELGFGSDAAARSMDGRRSGVSIHWSSSLLVRLAERRQRRLSSEPRILPPGCEPAADVTFGPRASDTSQQDWQRLVVPIDGSTETDALVPIAASWAAAYGFELLLVGVVVPEPPPVREGRQPRRHRFIADPLRHLLHLVETYGITDTEPLVQIIGDRLSASVALADHLRDEQASVLLVPATHRRTHWFRDDRSPRAFLKRSPVPVLTVHSPTGSTTPVANSPHPEPAGHPAGHPTASSRVERTSQ